MNWILRFRKYLIWSGMFLVLASFCCGVCCMSSIILTQDDNPPLYINRGVPMLHNSVDVTFNTVILWDKLKGCLLFTINWCRILQPYTVSHHFWPAAFLFQIDMPRYGKVKTQLEPLFVVQKSGSECPDGDPTAGDL